MPTPHYGLPRYRAIANELSERIESGVIPRGTLLPTEKALTAEFRTSRGTVRQAIAALRAEGVVITEHGRGTYANLRRPGVGSSEISRPEVRQRQVAADPKLAVLFVVAVGTPLVEEETINRTNGAVRTVVRTYRLP